jgi:2-dehydro-3-deoxygalactonokinase
LCGMAGARGALHEAGYVVCPAGVDDWKNGAAQAMFGAGTLRIAAGLACRSSTGRADVLRGEETQMFGAIALNPALGQGRHHVILPGTHSKWIELEDSRITGFRTFLTGELFALLQRSSLLAAPRMRVAAAQSESAGFAAGIARAQGGSGILGNLFEARAAQLLDGRSPEWAEGFISGLVIGSEVSEMLRTNPPPGAVTIIGDPQLAARYEAALDACGRTSQCGDGDACVLAGLRLLDADD